LKLDILAQKNKKFKFIIKKLRKENKNKKEKNNDIKKAISNNLSKKNSFLTEGNKMIDLINFFLQLI